MSSLRNILIIVVVIVLTGALSGCNNSTNAFGECLGHFGNAIQNVGEGVGALFIGAGDDITEASTAQRVNSGQNTSGQYAPVSPTTRTTRIDARSNNARDLD